MRIWSSRAGSENYYAAVLDASKKLWVLDFEDFPIELGLASLLPVVPADFFVEDLASLSFIGMASD